MQHSWRHILRLNLFHVQEIRDLHKTQINEINAELLESPFR